MPVKLTACLNQSGVSLQLGESRAAAVSASPFWRRCCAFRVDQLSVSRRCQSHRRTGADSAARPYGERVCGRRPLGQRQAGHQIKMLGEIGLKRGPGRVAPRVHARSLRCVGRCAAVPCEDDGVASIRAQCIGREARHAVGD
eukprot:scaffold5708_cov107-Isochrysis_galbana.AAC.3